MQTLIFVACAIIVVQQAILIACVAEIRNMLRGRF